MGWIGHVVVDVALGIGLLVAGIHGHGDDYLVLDAAGGYLILVTVLTDGPGGVWKVLPRLAHRVIDGVLALALIASPVIAWRTGVAIDAFATVLAVAVSVIVLRDAIVTDHRRAPRRPAGSGQDAIEARAFETGAYDAARRAGTLAGKAAGRASTRIRRRD